MRKLAFAVAALVALPVLAEEALITPSGESAVGQQTRLESKGIFYLKRKCDLPLVNAKDMRRFMFYRGKDGPNEVGCWGMTIENMLFTVVPHAESFTAPLEALHKADVREDGSATITALSANARKKR
ncbi:hypothetical protein BKK79_36120 [Cupriavidus sp. USMAA2-4]|uniref:hypothetical protein n=1 Tax=Cupriavidus sp. USMAA2-4 TaxID=876364 RepID=UPI0008A67910|nr:hypothetical protein [Cupriavidus sp. USMAA2-4]AOY96844.1 hypothetical protein BKK79_35715 [Cupriavidus sp. USMAA2-4]AOY96919.1 hypothetical protein BKK79_36120 [Cupriavidus sp. USMAA2-4]